MRLNIREIYNNLVQQFFCQKVRAYALCAITALALILSFTMTEYVDIIFFARSNKFIVFVANGRVFSLFFQEFFSSLLIIAIIWLFTLSPWTTPLVYVFFLYRGILLGIFVVQMFSSHFILVLGSIVFILPFQLILIFLHINFAASCAANCKSARMDEKIRFALNYLCLFAAVVLVEALVAAIIVRPFFVY